MKHFNFLYFTAYKPLKEKNQGGTQLHGENPLPTTSCRFHLESLFTFISILKIKHGSY